MPDDETAYKPGDGAAAFHEAAQAQSRKEQKEAAKVDEDAPANDGIFVRGDAANAETLSQDDIDKESRENVKEAAKDADR